jgi:hypothetical protein
MKTKTLFTRARETDMTILKENNEKLKENKGNGTPLHWLVIKGSPKKYISHIDTIINHPLIAEVKMDLKENPRWKNYLQHCSSYSRRVSKNGWDDTNCKEVFDVTPLHILAYLGYKEVLSHPLASVVKDSLGNTPLHILATSSQGRSKDITTPLWKLLFKHKDFNTVRNNDNLTPLEIFHVGHHPIYIKMLRKILTYIPSHYTDDQRVKREMWEEIISVPNSIKYILED